MKRFFLYAVVACSVWNSNRLAAQPTGDFVIGFPSPDSLLTNDSLFIYFHVPVSYQPGTPTKLIVGIHGIGDPSTSMLIRNYLASAGDSIGAIVACPDPYLQDQPRSQLVINIAIDSVLTWHDIDTSELYMAGYSAGSDVASQYNLQQPQHKVKGLIWFAPGFFYQPNLSAQTIFPLTCLCVGDKDFVSTILGQVTAIRDSFDHSPFLYAYNEIPDVAHTMNFPTFTTEMLECMRFFDDPINFMPDPTGILNDFSENTLNVFPNPSSGNVVIRFNEPVKDVSEIFVTDLSGKVVQALTVYPGGTGYMLDLASLKPGVFGIDVNMGGRYYHTKIIRLP